ncbi:MAG TPA: UDP-glucose--hexose-1-phosphate uridylyltransferase [Verrucomicrobiae bacterium]|nr:UDP-glucose--hexose-1-phosphate uridylyltransferase [Verrucomicrobiae bacterium]
MNKAANPSKNRGNIQNTPHLRFNPLEQEWVLVSPHRTQRPWLGKVEAAPSNGQPPYDPSCYLCPGNVRAGGVHNPNYKSILAFDNDFPALLPDAADFAEGKGRLLMARSERGICRVVCFSPRHDITISQMSGEELEAVVGALIAESESLSKIPWVRYVQIFENRGDLMGASNPHPHCQIWATSTQPNLPAKESNSFSEYWSAHSSCLLCEYLQAELELQERIVWQNDAFVVLVPFWAVWPFETLLLSKRHVASLAEFSPQERCLLGRILGQTTSGYDKLFDVSFPYSMGFHQCPSDEEPHPEWHLHAHYYPPLLRSATVRKFMVGFELLGTPQRDFTPEYAAGRLRQVAGAPHGGPASETQP